MQETPQGFSAFSLSDPVQMPRNKQLNVKISPFILKLHSEYEMDFSIKRKQTKISSEEKVDFFFTPMKISSENACKKTGYKKRLLFEEDETESSNILTPLTPIKNKRTYSESTLVEKQQIDNRRYLKIQRQLIARSQPSTSIPKIDIPTLHNSEHPDLPTISAKTLKSLMETSKNLILLDSRFSFEYEAGHINNSLNINNPFHFESLFFEYGHLLYSSNFLSKLPEICQINKKDLDLWLRNQNENKENIIDLQDPPIIVAHCEFSQKRGPKLLRYLRKRDREINEEHYPNLIYPHIFLLQGGYSNFVKEFPVDCTENGGYISMFNEKFKLECSFENSCYNKFWNDIKTTKFVTNFY